MSLVPFRIIKCTEQSRPHTEQIGDSGCGCATPLIGAISSGGGGSTQPSGSKCLTQTFRPWHALHPAFARRSKLLMRVRRLGIGGYRTSPCLGVPAAVIKT
jgi:hypothetical protein